MSGKCWENWWARIIPGMRVLLADLMAVVHGVLVSVRLCKSNRYYPMINTYHYPVNMHGYNLINHSLVAHYCSTQAHDKYLLVICYSLLLKMTIEIVSFPY